MTVHERKKHVFAKKSQAGLGYTDSGLTLRGYHIGQVLGGMWGNGVFVEKMRDKHSGDWALVIAEMVDIAVMEADAVELALANE